MIKYILLFLAVQFILLFTACEEKNTPESSVVINELMAVNSTIQADQNGEFDDWIELSNKSEFEMDLSGYFLTDSKSNPDKWQIPAGTRIPAKGFLIVWADNDTLQSGLHANFKLSSEGEKLYFMSRDLLIIDRVEYPAQPPEEHAYARNPDWAGSFGWQTPTYCASNNSR